MARTIMGLALHYTNFISESQTAKHLMLEILGYTTYIRDYVAAREWKLNFRTSNVRYEFFKNVCGPLDLALYSFR